MEWESITMLLEESTRDNGQPIKKMGMESFNTLITINIKVIGKTEKDPERACINTPTAIFILDNGYRISNKATAYCKWLLEIDTKAIG